MTPARAAREGLSFVRIVRVGSANSPKIEAVRSAIAAFSPDVKVVGHAVESGVSQQPVGLAEIVAGARNRARAAWRAGACELAVGLEDGLVELPELEADAALNVGAAVVTDGQHESLGLSSGFAYPPACLAHALREREPIGELFDDLWRAYADDDEASAGPGRDSGRSVGNIGKLTLGVLERSEYGRHAVICALVRFLHPGLYFEERATGPLAPACPAEPRTRSLTAAGRPETESTHD